MPLLFLPKIFAPHWSERRHALPRHGLCRRKLRLHTLRRRGLCSKGRGSNYKISHTAACARRLHKYNIVIALPEYLNRKTKLKIIVFDQKRRWKKHNQNRSKKILHINITMKESDHKRPKFVVEILHKIHILYHLLTYITLYI